MLGVSNVGTSDNIISMLSNRNPIPIQHTYIKHPILFAFSLNGNSLSPRTHGFPFASGSSQGFFISVLFLAILPPGSLFRDIDINQDFRKQCVLLKVLYK